MDTGKVPFGTEVYLVIENPINEDNLRYLNDFKYKTLEKFLKNFYKILDIHYKICYNVYRVKVKLTLPMILIGQIYQIN